MIGVLGGTFDPIHFGHLRPALEVFLSIGLEQLRFIPLNVAVHRRQPQATGDQRVAMVRAAVAGQAGFVVDEKELKRPGRSYSHDTLSSLREELGGNAPLCLLIGSDAFRHFLTWKRPEGILECAHLVVMQRPGPDQPRDPRLVRWSEPYVCSDPAALSRAPGGRILYQQVTQLDISGTAIRELVAKGLSPRYLVPESVLKIIQRNAIYRS
jgi:nicotinate-nucleotide adenylyltransferase